MTKFKQIIGRGTRINEELGKLFFTILDFRNATDLFADKAFDGEPIRVKKAKEDDDLGSVTDEEEAEPLPVDEETGQEVEVQKPITVSLKDHTADIIHQSFASLDDFLNRWNEAERKEAIIKELQEQGVLVDALGDAVDKQLDLFDLICHVAFDRPPLTRRERANNVKKRDYFTK